MAAEEALILGAISSEAEVVAADSRGTMVDSAWFRDRIRGAMVGSRDLVFLIGGSSGLTDRVLSRANHTIAMGRITMNHDLASAVLLEQIWRGVAMINNHPYHRDHE